MTPATATGPRQVAGELLREAEAVQEAHRDLEAARSRRDEVLSERDGLAVKLGELEARLETVKATAEPGMDQEIDQLVDEIDATRVARRKAEERLDAWETAVGNTEKARAVAMIHAAPERWAAHEDQVRILGERLRAATTEAVEALEELRRLARVRGAMDHQAATLVQRHATELSSPHLPEVAQLLGVSSRDWKEAGDGLIRATTFTAITATQMERKADADD